MPTLRLYSRHEMVGDRRVEIHELTASEIAWLKHQRVLFAFVGFLLGMIPFAMTVAKISELCRP